MRPLRAPHLSCLPKKGVPKKGTPTSGFRYAKLDSLCSPCGPACGCYSASLRFLAPALLRGRLTRAIHGPLSLSPHPCGSLPYATPLLGLLKGIRSRACVIFAELELAASDLCLCSSTAMVQTTPKPPSGGRVESPRKGLSDMDVARAAMGQGWPFAACPWSGDGAREPRRSRGRM